EFIERGAHLRDLITFHTEHKLLILSHSPKHFSDLGRLVARAREYNSDALLSEYIGKLMRGLQLIATVKKNTNVLLHLMGFFKRHLSSDEKQELLEVIEHYHRELIPLIVPVTLIKHYVRKFDEPYLKRQYYLNPHPIELMLRNHV
ncbi:MAG: DUF1722 domain-containing protein, partial [Nitrospira sp.]|nr:DUF1722 domain-containing protein [Nitrospira sp.]